MFKNHFSKIRILAKGRKKGGESEKKKKTKEIAVDTSEPRGKRKEES